MKVFVERVEIILVPTEVQCGGTYALGMAVVETKPTAAEAVVVVAVV
jgi:hypothetical protein